MKGFSLTELIVVIIILSIVTVIGLPNFLSFNSQSKISALSQIKANAYNVLADTNTKSILRKIETDCFAYIDDIYVCRGYPTAHSDNVIRAFSVDDERLYVTNRGNNNQGREAFIGYTRDDVWYSDCYIRYKDAVSGAFQLQIVTDGC
ncbi:prepilin-type N-terminal cleavage/methylation domain-containing protein [Vibrio sp. MarTm2]|uniref:prepilin-type N-terminal cleavage/methylation domain-containing protein n=1 Tax=Vibrio sp. MarTm2 TaxID=2998831 RepID=UPI0022CD52E9|nr:prepilin-type N-terminal cleavage/methylation domain-containing protein [Vibrio sp. MarTm2]MDA0128124.1 prepilin-type N-terminal cleavage/methylation domain-containing protein [Vibrio sp. MarTm2]